jgi:hypothetical protein
MSQLVAFTYGSAKVPEPEPPVHVAEPVSTHHFRELKRLVDVTGPPAVCTVSTTENARIVSLKSSLLFLIEYVHVYGSKIFVGD